MTIAETKNVIHKLVVETEDPAVLEQVENFFRSLLGQADWWENISDRERRLIERGLKQLDAGEAISSKIVRENVEKRFENARRHE